jgi:hypothetical protein
MVRIALKATFIASVLALATAGPLRRQDASVLTLPLTKISGSLRDIVNKDQGRLAYYATPGPRLGNLGSNDDSNSSSSAPVTNTVDSYIAAVTVGSQTFNLVVDTGSSNTWVGATTQYQPGSTSNSTGDSITVSYGSGSFSGTEYTDDVTVGGTTVNGQSIGVASTSTGFTGVDGIIGFGPVDLTANTVNGAASVPTFMDNLLAQGTISQEVLGISFAPESGSDSNDANGELTFGSVDSSKFTGSITYAPLQGQYWGINVDGITYNGKSIGKANSAIVDTGTTLIYIPTDAYNAFVKATGGAADSASGLLSFTKKPTENLVFSIAGTDFPLTPDQYLIPQAQYTNNQLSGSKFFSWVGDGGSASPGFILGMKFLENYYSVFDTTNSQVGLAPSSLVSSSSSAGN